MIPRQNVVFSQLESVLQTSLALDSLKEIRKFCRPQSQQPLSLNGLVRLPGLLGSDRVPVLAPCLPTLEQKGSDQLIDQFSKGAGD